MYLTRQLYTSHKENLHIVIGTAYNKVGDWTVSTWNNVLFSYETL